MVQSFCKGILFQNLGKFYVFLESKEKKSVGKIRKRISIPLLELKLNNHHGMFTNLNKWTDVKLGASAVITEVPS